MFIFTMYSVICLVSSSSVKIHPGGTQLIYYFVRYASINHIFHTNKQKNLFSS